MISFNFYDYLSISALPSIQLYTGVERLTYLMLDQVPYDLPKTRLRRSNALGYAGIKIKSELRVVFLKIVVMCFFDVVEFIYDRKVCNCHAKLSVANLVHLTVVPYSEKHVPNFVLGFL